MGAMGKRFGRMNVNEREEGMNLGQRNERWGDRMNYGAAMKWGRYEKTALP